MFFSSSPRSRASYAVLIGTLSVCRRSKERELFTAMDATAEELKELKETCKDVLDIDPAKGGFTQSGQKSTKHGPKPKSLSR